MIQFNASGIYFGDFKEDNFLITFHGLIVKIADFGCSFMLEDRNYLKGLSYGYSIPALFESMSNGRPVAKTTLEKNDSYALFRTIEKLIGNLE